MKKIQGIYLIIHIETGKTYVGSSKHINRRLGAHKTELKNDKHHNPILQRYYNKYGHDAFLFMQIASVFENEKLIDVENEIIAQINESAIHEKLDHSKIFNTQWANQTGCVNPDNYKKGEEHHLFGTVGSNKGKIFNATTRKNMSVGQKGKKYPNRKPQSQTARDAAAATKKGVPWSDARRKAYEKSKKP